MAVKGIATLRPEEDNPTTGQLTFAGRDKSYRYYCKEAPAVGKGIYHIEGKMDRRINSHNSQPYRVVLIDTIDPPPSDSVQTLRGYVDLSIPSSVSQRVFEQIFERFGHDISAEKLKNLLLDKVYLKTISGVGPSRVDKIKEAVREMNSADFKVYELLSSWGIPYDRKTKRCLGLIHIAKVNAGYLKKIEKNPYELCDINVSSSVLRAVRRNLEDYSFTPVNYPFKLVDGCVLDTRPEWKLHEYRMQAHVFQIFDRIKRNGHTVATSADLLKELRKTGFTKYVPAIYEEHGARKEVEVTGKIVRKLFSEHPRLSNVRFQDKEGDKVWGLCLNSDYKAASTVKEALFGLRDGPSMIPATMAGEMYYSTLRRADINPTAEQLSALRNAFNSNISAVKGGPGRGKTWLAQTYLTGAVKLLEERVSINVKKRKLDHETGRNIYILAPTGAAVQRIRQGLTLTHENGKKVPILNVNSPDRRMAGHIKCGSIYLSTLHSFLGYRGGSIYMPPKAHPSVLYIDEVSMCDTEIMYQLFRYVQNCLDKGHPVTVFMSGDDEQLPPVGAGFPFRDILGRHLGAAVPITHLTRNMRQAKGSMIAKKSEEVRRGSITPMTYEEYNEQTGYDESSYRDGVFAYKDSEDGRTIAPDFDWIRPSCKYAYYSASVTQALEEFIGDMAVIEDLEVPDVQVVLPLRNQSSVEPDAPYVKRVNKTMQQLHAEKTGNTIYPITIKTEEYEYTAKFCEGDKVIHAGSNGYKGDVHEPIMRGSIGRITDIDIKSMSVHVQYPWLDHTVLYQGGEDIHQISLSYAITGHSAQGSEFDYVLMFIPDRGGRSVVDQAWLNTSLTRARKYLRLYASTRRMKKAVRTNYGRERNTILSKLLQTKS